VSRRPEVWRWGDSLDVIREGLAGGEMLAVPTESSYALAVDPRSAKGVESVYRFKARSGDKPLPVVVGALEHLAMLGIDIDDPGLRILTSLWPAPLSVVLPIRQSLPASGASGSLAVRIPDHPRLVELLANLRSPLTATSANSSGEAPICDPVDLALRLVGWPALIVDDGLLPGGAPSTIVALGPTGLEVLRVGRYPVAELRRRLTELGWSSGFSAATAEKSADRPAEPR
jgi:L-threonylcarbamoyladenylate synthase